MERPDEIKRWERLEMIGRLAVDMARPMVRDGLRALGEQQSRAAAAQRPGSTSVVSRPRTALATRQNIDGAKTLDHVRTFLGRYVWFASETQLDTVALWAAATHVRTEEGWPAFREFPHLYMLSSEPGSGKTRVLEMLTLLCPGGEIVTEPTAPALTLLLGKEHATVCLDESDVLFGRGSRKEAVRAIINTSYKRGGSIPRERKGALERRPVYGALALAGLDVMEKGTGDTLNALLSRGIRIRMRKPPAGTPIRKVREVIDAERGITGEGVAARIMDRLSVWAAQERAEMAGMMPAMPPGVELRQEELWAPLLAVAEQAGGRWPQAAWEAAVDLSLYGGTPDVEADDLDDVMAGMG